MTRKNKSLPPEARSNRRGCWTLLVIIALVLAALAYIGFSGDPINDLETSIPTLG